MWRLTLILLCASGALAQKIDVYKKCNTVSCLGIPTDCVGSKNCRFIVGIHYDPKTDQLETYFYSTKPNDYIALGISGDAKMGNDDVIGALIRKDPQGVQSVFFVLGRNDGYAFTKSTQFKSPQGSSFQVVNGGFAAAWTLPVASLPPQFEYKDFKANKPYLLLATGAVSEASDANTSPESSYGLVQHSGEGRAASGFNSNFAEVHRLSAAREPVEHLIHALCMIWAFMFLMPTGILIARYYKETWAHVRIFRRRFWFILHVCAMLLALICALAGYITIVVHHEGIFRKAGDMTPIHQAVGFVALILLLFQCVSHWCHVTHPFVGVLLAGVHTLVGVVCYLFGMFNIITVEAVLGGSFRENAQWLPLASLLLLLLFFLCLSSFYSWTDYHLSVNVYRAFCSFPLHLSSDEEAPRPNVRKGLLLAFAVLAFLICSIYSGMALYKQYGSEA